MNGYKITTSSGSFTLVSGSSINPDIRRTNSSGNLVGLHPTINSALGDASSGQTVHVYNSGYPTVSSNCQLNSGVTLIFDPACTVKFASSTAMSVYGAIDAQGTSANPILFTSLTGTSPNSWNYFKIYNGNSVFKYCTFQYGYYPLYLYNATSGTTTVIEHCSFTNNLYGLRVYGSNANIKDCVMANNTLQGVQCQGAPLVKFIGNWIHDNTRNGIYTLSSNLLQFYGNVIEANGTDTIHHGISTANLDVIQLGLAYTVSKNTVRWNYGAEVYASSGDPDVHLISSSIHDDGEEGHHAYDYDYEVYNTAGNDSAIYTYYCYWDDDCEHYGSVIHDQESEPIPNWDGTTYDDVEIPKALVPEDSLVIDNGTKIQQLKELIQTRPGTTEAESAIGELYSIIRADYVEDELGEKRNYFNYLDGVYSSQKNLRIGKQALRQMILWKMLERDLGQFVQLSKTGLKELDGVDRMYVLTDLGFSYALTGDLEQAGQCLDEMKRKYPDQKELIRLLGDDIADVKWQIEKGLFAPSMELAPFAEGSTESEEITVLTLENYPNPANPLTTIRFSLPEKTAISVKIMNILGEVVCTLADHPFEAGVHEVKWDGRDTRGLNVSSGIYLFQVRTPNKAVSKKLMLLK